MKKSEIGTRWLKMALFAAAFSFEAAEAADIRTVDGRTYHDVKFDRVSAKGLTFRHSCGIVTLDPDKFHPDDRKAYSAQIADYNALKRKREGKLQKINNRQKSLAAKEEINAIIRMYEGSNPDAPDRMEKAIEKYDGTPEAENGKKLLAEWRKKKQTQLWVHHPEVVNEYRVYLFDNSAVMESTLKDIAEIHWKINQMNDQYMQAQAAARMEMRTGNPHRAEKTLDLAKNILQESQEARNRNNKQFENLLARPGSVLYQTTINGRGVRLDGVNREYIIFIVEVVERGKYVRAWCSSGRGGSDLFIKGEKITCVDGGFTRGGKEQNTQDPAGDSEAGEPSGHFDLAWVLQNKGNLNKTGDELKAEGFQYDARYDMYKKEPAPPAVLMNCFMENGQVKRFIIYLSSYLDADAAADRYAKYTANFEKQIKGQVKSECNSFTTKSQTNTKVIKVYNLVDHDFMVAVYQMSLPVINKHIIFLATFSKKIYPDFDSVVKELGK